MSDDTYNGWKNYETWAVGMYLDGNYTGEGTYRYTINVVENAMWEGGENHKRSHVADALKNLLQTDCDPCGYGDDDGPELHPLVSDLLGAALSSVDWYELADAWIDNVREQVEA